MRFAVRAREIYGEELTGLHWKFFIITFMLLGVLSGGLFQLAPEIAYYLNTAAHPLPVVCATK
jgi:hypothetical protein